MLTTSELRKVWGPVCGGFQRTRVVLYGNAPITVDVRTAAAFEALSACLARNEYKCDPVQTGAFNCRAITGGSGYSLHAYGIAVDINWLRNPYGPVLKTDMPASLVRDIQAIRTVDGVQVFRWGGTYSGNKDAMHYEIVCSPADLARGLDFPSTPTYPPPTTTKPDPTRPAPVDPTQELPVRSIVNPAYKTREVFTLIDGQPQHQWYAANGDASGWEPVTNNIGKMVGLDVNVVDDTVIVTALGAYLGEWICFWTKASGWTKWSSMHDYLAWIYAATPKAA